MAQKSTNESRAHYPGAFPCREMSVSLRFRCGLRKLGLTKRNVSSYNVAYSGVTLRQQPPCNVVYGLTSMLRGTGRYGWLRLVLDEKACARTRRVLHTRAAGTEYIRCSVVLLLVVVMTPCETVSRLNTCRPPDDVVVQGAAK